MELTKGFLHFGQYARCEWMEDGKPHVIVEECLYSYSVSSNPDDEDDWILRYEYSEVPKSGKPQSHIHVNGRHRKFDGLDYKAVHLPTSRLSLEQFLACLIDEFEVGSYPDALEVLRESHLGFLARRTDIYEPKFP